MEQVLRIARGDLLEPVRLVIERPVFQRVIIGLILVNAVLLGLETSPSVMATWGGTVTSLDRGILAIFVVEIAARLFVYRAAFWRDPWSIFDFAVVAIALVPSAGPFAVLRALRVLRVLRLLTIVPSMRRVVGALLAAIPGLGSIMLVLAILYYVFAVIATSLFSAAYPEWFGTIGRSLYTLFQIMTLESWSMGIARPVMENFPHAWAFFVAFILIATFTMLNLFIGIIVNAMQRYSENEQEQTVPIAQTVPHSCPSALHDEIANLNAEIVDFKKMLLSRLNEGPKQTEAGIRQESSNRGVAPRRL
jgi:voltage-gated sodium channel